MINWFDGKDAEGMFVLEICFDDGSKAYMKNKDQNKIDNYHSLLSGMPEVSGLIIHNPELREAA